MTGNFPTYRTAQLLMRQFTANDLENVFNGLSHPDIIKYYGVNFTSLEATKAQIEWFAELEKNGTGIWWAICSPDDKVFIGAAGLYYINHTHHKGEIGFWMMPEYWGKGIMKEAVPLACAYGFNELKLHRIEALIESGNFNSKKFMEKVQFQYEGTMRDCEIKNGRYISLDMYALLG